MNYKEAALIAVKLLSIRSYSTFELRKKLVQKGVSEDICEIIVDEFLEKKYLNDNEYFAGRIRYYLKQKKSPSYIRDKCLKIGKDLSYEEIENYYSEINENKDDHIQYHIDKKLRSLKNDLDEFKKKEKIMRTLISKGYREFNIDKYLK